MYQKIDLPNAQLELHTDVDLGYDREELFHNLYNNVPWEQRYVTIYGNTYPEPRKTMWYGDHSYTYSGLRLPPCPFNQELSVVSNKLQELTNAFFNGVLLNLYQDGRSSIGMHCDDEPEFGNNPTIASVSLGQERTILFQRKDKQGEVVKIPLPSGSVLVMSGETQNHWKHGIPKTTKQIGPRINLTFRNIVNIQN